MAEGDGVLRPHGIHRGGTLTETAVKEDTIAVMNVVETLWEAYPDSIDNSDGSSGKGRNSLDHVNRTTAWGSRNGYVRALVIMVEVFLTFNTDV